MQGAGSGIKPTSDLLLPKTALAGSIVLALLRDTRGVDLSANQRFNHFSISPFCSVTWIFNGQIHLVTNQNDARDPASASPMDKISFSGPNDKPVMSWNPGPVEAMTIGFYPNAWQALTGTKTSDYLNRTLPLSEVNAGELLAIAESILSQSPMKSRFELFQNQLAPLWADRRPQNDFLPNGIADWASTMGSRAAMGKSGKNLRQLQRRLKQLAGQSRRDLMAHARAESLFAHYVAHQKQHGTNLSQIALDAGYADQSHMGREVNRITGVSPACIDKLIAVDERYWCYRSLQQHYY